jgi:aminopeptidase N
MSLTTPQIKKRSDYQVPNFLIDQLKLEFHLDGANTRVFCTSQVKRNGQHKRPLVLDGEQLTLVNLSINSRLTKDYSLSDTGLTIPVTEDWFELTVETQCDPQANKSLEGLYLSAGAYCTQCEAEGFRKITYFLDRPDVLASYEVTIYADKTAYPYLLSNGNTVAHGDLEDGRHWVTWQDPFKKPCYLFALVAGDFDLLEDSFTTQSGRVIKLQLFVDKGMAGRGTHALTSLKKAMIWDEQVFGLEYDLDIYMIVAVDFFNMGAMENKGLNVFNSKFVLADQASATDEDYFNIEAVIAHEYFHNWTGNRVTCRDWFQLSLKEGLTVFRDQQFSADMSSAVVNRIKNVRIMREHQFAEDSSPMSHPIRPDEVMEMNNFYTVTVYDKGAEVIRMMHTLLGQDGFRKGMDLYFQRFDGQAVTCDDFVQAMEDANGKDLTQFSLWYSQSGTPKVTVTDHYDAANKTYRINFGQQHGATADQSQKQNLHIPIKYDLLDEKGKTLLNKSQRYESGALLELTDNKQELILENIVRKPIPSLLHDFSAPVRLIYDYDWQQLAHIMSYSTDDFARWDASQSLFSDCIHKLSSSEHQQQTTLIEQILSVVQGILDQRSCAPALLAEMLSVPSFETLCQQVDEVQLDKLYQARLQLLTAIGSKLFERWQALYASQNTLSYEYSPSQVDVRRMRNLCLQYLSYSGHEEGQDLLLAQYQGADNMTDTLGALKAAQQGSLNIFDKLMQDFEQKWHKDPLVLDKWFALHANTNRPDILPRLELLMGHSQYTINNPNRVRSLVGSFAFYNIQGFHAIDGSGYRFVADYLMRLNSVNPQVAARIVTPLTQWQKFDSTRQELMQHQLARIADCKDLSIDLYEKVTKSLNYKK